MEKDTRNTLRNAVTKARRLLEDAVGDLLTGRYGIYPDGKTLPEADLPHLDDEGRAERARLLVHYERVRAGGFADADAVDQLKREIAFTHLNRLAAFKLMEARDLIREAVSRGVDSRGVQYYIAEHPDDERRYDTGDKHTAYRNFLKWQAAQFADEISVLFNPEDPANIVFPPQRALDDVLELLNSEALAGIWTEDETIGWVYQYFTPKELRDKARSESQAPRNSYELAFRNQFFTPRYVVEFLTDNTLGRTWYEMQRGDTHLTDICRYLVRRPNEIFLAEGEQAPPRPEGEGDTGGEGSEDLSQEELLRQPVYIPYRRKKDPRRLRILDPACGSGHFLLYTYDLLTHIYEEAYADPDTTFNALRREYKTLDDLRRDVPRLILRHNLHGVDIDPRAIQIAALALWLRAQRSYQAMGYKRGEARPQITRSNLVTAEPMPGDRAMLDEFCATLNPPLLGDLVRNVFDKMELAGEAGSLLKIEEEIREDIAKARKAFEKGPTPQQNALFPEYTPEPAPQQGSLFDLSGLDDAHFFDSAEKRVLEALQAYAEQAGNGRGLGRRLFAEDTARGFAFIELMRQRYDVVLMNPPFGEPSQQSKDYINDSYPLSSKDIYSAFVELGTNLYLYGMLGSITSRTAFFLGSGQTWRETILLEKNNFICMADLGMGVLDNAMVETAAYVVGGPETIDKHHQAVFIRLSFEDEDRKHDKLFKTLKSLLKGDFVPDLFLADPDTFRIIPQTPFSYWVSESFRRKLKSLPPFEPTAGIARRGPSTGDDTRRLRGWWEVPPMEVGRYMRWVPYPKGGSISPYFGEIPLLVSWDETRRTFLDFYGRPGRPISKPECLEDFFYPGLTWPRRTSSFAPHVMPAGCIFSVRGQAILSDKSKLLAIMGMGNSAVFDFIYKLSLGRWDYPEFINGILQNLPWAEPNESQAEQLSNLALEAYKLQRQFYTFDETTHVFELPVFVIQEFEGTLLRDKYKEVENLYDLNETRLQDMQSKVDAIAFAAYSTTQEDEEFIRTELSSTNTSRESNLSHLLEDISDQVMLFLMWLVGATLGRWDIRYATGEQPIPDLPDPFDPLPACPPGMLQGADGLPLTASPPGYPLDVVWDGILVDDEGHPDDIIGRVRSVLALLWEPHPQPLSTSREGSSADAIEAEMLDILGEQSLRGYFRKSGNGGFWMSHVKRYSKSRRKAPIYWYLRSANGNYGLWLYYHRLTKDMLYQALEGYVRPKLALEQAKAERLRGEGVGGRELAAQDDLVSEIRDFHDKLEQAAALGLTPDLNDGVVLNIAPLHALVPWKEAAKYWKDLLGGKYEWSTISQQLRNRGHIG